MRFWLSPSELWQWFRSRHFGRNSIDSRYALMEACIIGFFAALAALVIKEGVNWLGTWRLQSAQLYGAMWVLPLAGFSFCWLAGWLLEQFSPSAAGGGIPQVKAALARYPIELSWRVAIIKLLGTVLILGGGITLGRRAPTVHIGASLAGQLSRWLPTSPEHRRQMIAAGAAAGLAAGFTTPIAGVLFVVEELMRDVSSLTLETAIVASFVGAVTSLLLQSADLNFPHKLTESVLIQFSAPEIPFYILLGVIAGTLGAFFNRGILISQQLHRRMNLPLAWRLGLVGLLSGSIIALMPPFFRDNAGLREFVITGELSWESIVMALVAHFFLTMIAYSADAPGGLFAPALVMGAALGYLVGDVGDLWIKTGTEATYALAGMGAFFTSVVRVPVTAIVIVFELTGNFNIVLPLMVACAVSYMVAESIFPRSLYEHLLEAKGIFLTEDKPSRDFMAQMTARQVMQSNVESMDAHLTLEKVLPLMSRSHHRGFPVVEEGRLVGVFTQTDLANAQVRSPQTPLRELMTPRPITVLPDAPLSDVLYLLNRYQLSRLPVIQGQKLVGIITRTDIIREEVSQLGGELSHKSVPSYSTYQTRGPALGEGRILLPLQDSNNALALFQIAKAIAQTNQAEMDCLQVLKIPKYRQPSEFSLPTQANRKLLQRLERLGRHDHLLVNTQILLAHNIAEAILDTIRDRQINLLVMGWDEHNRSPGSIFGQTIDTLIEKAPCDLLLVKLGKRAIVYPHDLQQAATWLIPMAGGPNVQRAFDYLPGLLSLYPDKTSPELILSKVFLPSDSQPAYSTLYEVSQTLQERISQPITSVPLCSRSVSDAIISLAEMRRCSVILLGASREGLLKTVLHGNIPALIADQVDSTVLTLRAALTVNQLDITATHYSDALFTNFNQVDD